MAGINTSVDPNLVSDNRPGDRRGQVSPGAELTQTAWLQHQPHQQEQRYMQMQLPGSGAESMLIQEDSTTDVCFFLPPIVVESGLTGYWGKVLSLNFGDRRVVGSEDIGQSAKAEITELTKTLSEFTRRLQDASSAEYAKCDEPYDTTEVLTTIRMVIPQLAGLSATAEGCDDLLITSRSIQSGRWDCEGGRGYFIKDKSDPKSAAVAITIQDTGLSGNLAAEIWRIAIKDSSGEIHLLSFQYMPFNESFESFWTCTESNVYGGIPSCRFMSS